MDKKNILLKLTEIFKDEFDDEELIINERTSPEDIEEWNSLTMVNLMSTIANEFSINFNMGELKNIHCVEDIIEIIFNRQ